MGWNFGYPPENYRGPYLIRDVGTNWGPTWRPATRNDILRRPHLFPREVVNEALRQETYYHDAISERNKREAREIRIQALRINIGQAAEIITQNLMHDVSRYQIEMSETEVRKKVLQKLSKDENWYLTLKDQRPQGIVDCFFQGIRECYSRGPLGFVRAHARWLVDHDTNLHQQLERAFEDIDLKALNDKLEQEARQALEYQRLWIEGRDYALAQQCAGHLTPPDTEETISTWTEAGQQGYRAQWDHYLKQLEEANQTIPTTQKTASRTKPATNSPIADSQAEIDATWAGFDPLAIPGRYLERFAPAGASRPNPQNSVR